MRALIWDGQQARLTEHPKPKATPTMAVVRVALAGVCNTDLEIIKGYMAFRGVLGHEFTGTVVEGPDNWRGSRVVAEINFACGQCETCRAGLGRHCPKRHVLGIDRADGAFAEYVAVPVANLHRVPDGVSNECAVFTEPLAAAFEILEQLPDVSGTPCIVLGDGKLGLLTALVLHQAGARVLAVGKHPEKMARLTDRGITSIRIEELGSQSAPLVVEATGSLEGLRKAITLTQPRGTIVLKSTLADSTQIDLTPLVIHELRVLGSRCGPFPPALEALATGKVDPTPLISDRLPLIEAETALSRARQPGMLKVLIESE